MISILAAVLIGYSGINPYTETLRPQFHFTSQTNWLNDPNGLVYYKGEYHLFYQHNPTGLQWGNMHWGHAISKDIVHWKQQPVAIAPDELGAVFSGSAVVDWENTSGLKSGKEDVLIAIYTAASEQSTQCIAYSNDKGITWTKYSGNPVLPEGSRDPKVFRFKDKWIMALYRQENGIDGIMLYSSPDLKSWKPVCFTPGFFECPDMFELAVDGNQSNKKWVMQGAAGNYLIGSFDGENFKPESNMLMTDYGGTFYASQTYSDIPKRDGRRIQIAWMNGGQYPDMPFNQQMSFPCVLTLKKFPEGIQMCRMPIREIKSLYEKKYKLRKADLIPGKSIKIDLNKQEIDLSAEIDLRKANEVGLNIGDQTITYSAKDHTIACLGRTVKLEPVDNKIKLRILVDRTSIELFGNDGKLSMSTCYIPKGSDHFVEYFCSGGDAKIIFSDIYELKSSWAD